MKQVTRQCVICRKHSDKKDLFRMALNAKGRPVIDLDYTIQSRGVYLCPDATCLTKARKQNAIGRSLDVQVPNEIYLRLAKIISRTDAETPGKLLGLAIRARNVVVGSTAVELGLKRGKVRLVLIDISAAEATILRTEMICQAARRSMIQWPVRNGLAEMAGKVNCRVIGITDNAFAHALIKQLSKLTKDS